LFPSFTGVYLSSDKPHNGETEAQGKRVETQLFLGILSCNERTFRDGGSGTAEKGGG